MSTAAQHWSNDYLRIPYVPHGRNRDGVDCYGLVRMVLADRAGLNLPCLAERYEGIEDREAIWGLLDEARHGTDWQIVEGPARELDVVLIRVGLCPLHVGVMVNVAEFLHIERELEVMLARIDRQPWCRKIVGIYRHARLA